MLITDMERLIRAGKNLSGRTWEEVSHEINVPPSNIIRAIQRKQINERYIQIAEALGFDVEVRLTAKGEEL